MDSPGSTAQSQSIKQVYARLYLAFCLLMQEETFNGPSELPAGTHLNYLVKGVQQILDIFVQKGFALKVSPIQQRGMWTQLCKTSLCLV